MKLKERIVMILVVTVVASVVLIVRIQVTLTDVQATPTPPSVHTLATSAKKASVLLAHELPSQLLQQLPHQVSRGNRTHFSERSALRRNRTSQGERLQVTAVVSSKDPWVIWRDWVKPDALYQEGCFYSKEMNHILAVMVTAPITSFDIGHKGTQLKATAILLGTQRTVFKPKR